VSEFAGCSLDLVSFAIAGRVLLFGGVVIIHCYRDVKGLQRLKGWILFWSSAGTDTVHPPQSRRGKVPPPLHSTPDLGQACPYGSSQKMDAIASWCEGN